MRSWARAIGRAKKSVSPPLREGLTLRSSVLGGQHGYAADKLIFPSALRRFFSAGTLLGAMADDDEYGMGGAEAKAATHDERVAAEARRA